MDAYYCTPLSPFAPAIGAAFASFTTRQDVSPLPLPILPANVCRLGTCIKIEAEGEFSATTTGPTYVFGFYAGVPGASGGGTITSVLAENSAFTSGNSAASWPWRMEYRGKIVTIGTSGSIVGTGNFEFGTSLTATTTVPIPATLALRTVAINTTVSNAIGVCCTCGTSNAANSVKTYQITAVLQN